MIEIDGFFFSLYLPLPQIQKSQSRVVWPMNASQRSRDCDRWTDGTEEGQFEVKVDKKLSVSPSFLLQNDHNLHHVTIARHFERECSRRNKLMTRLLRIGP